MTYVPTIYDWNELVTPLNMLFRAGGSQVDGGMTLGGVSVSNPEPGGRFELLMEFPQFASVATNVAASWTISRITNGSVMRIIIPRNHVQLVPDSDLGISTDTGIKWSNNLAWSLGQPWRNSAIAPISTAASAGESTVRVNLTAYGSVISPGHVIGIYADGYQFCHMVMDVSGGTSNKALAISPPLRRDVATTDIATLRPIAQVTCANPREVGSLFRWGATAQLNAARFVEALV